MWNWRKPVVMMMGCSALLACGGGGGGDGETFYGGIWRFTGIKVSDSCGAGAENTTSFTLTVNQDGERVVVDSGSVVLEGTTHADDGFAVVNVSSRSSGCQTETAFDFQDASDGEAVVGLAIVSQCSDSPVTCTLAYGGTATRTNGRSLATDMDDDLGVLTEGFVERSQGLDSSEYAGENISAEAEARIASVQVNQP